MSAIIVLLSLALAALLYGFFYADVSTLERFLRVALAVGTAAVCALGALVMVPFL